MKQPKFSKKKYKNVTPQKNEKKIPPLSVFHQVYSQTRDRNRKMQNLILGGVLRGIFKIQQCLVPPKSIFDLFGQKWPARMVTVNLKLSISRIDK